MPATRVPLETLIDLYVNQQLSSGEVAARVGLDPVSVRGRLRRHGLTRSIAEANRLSAARVTPEARMRRVAAAHDALRGKSRPREEMLKRSASHFRNGDNIGPHEVTFKRMLEERGLSFTQQHPIDVYNVDFALAEHHVAVEVVAGGGNERVRANRPHRLETLRDRGWRLFEIRFSSVAGDRMWGMGVVDELIAFVDEGSLDPSSASQHRVVRPNGRRVKTRRGTPRKRH